MTSPATPTAAECLAQASALLANWLGESSTPEPNRVDATIEAGNLTHAVRAMQDADWGYLSAITGLDFGPEAGRLEVLYHFCSGPAVFTLRVRLGRDNPDIASICDIIPSAGFFEQELMEMFGVTVTGTPSTDHLFLPDDWPDGAYPLRKDFDPAVIRAKGGAALASANGKGQ